MIFDVVYWLDDAISLVALIAFTYIRYGSAVAPVVLLGLYVLLNAFFSREFAFVVIGSLLMAEYLVYDRLLQAASDTTKAYTAMALSFLLMVFAVAVLTGYIEPYQAAIICLVLYVVQARVKTGGFPLGKVFVKQS